jgi:hypothetical protein
MTEAEALAAMIDRNENGAKLMRELPPQGCARLARLNLVFSDVSQSSTESEGLQRFELTLRSFDSELKSMLKASALATEALTSIAAAIKAYGTDDASDAWAVADGAVKKVRKERKKGPHAFVACFDQLAKLDRLYEHRPPRDDF